MDAAIVFVQVGSCRLAICAFGISNVRMKLSIIIPTLNEASCIIEAIRRAWATGPYEVIVVDGGSEDGTIELAQTCSCQFLRTQQGRAEQQNAGARCARGDVLLFLHADNWLEARSTGQIADALSNPSVLGGAFEQQIEAPGFFYRFLERGNALRAKRLGLPYGDQGIFMRRSTFESLGGFPKIRLMEDYLLMKKFRNLSKPVLLPGPIHVSARRWQRHGLVRQTLRNWVLLGAVNLGLSPDRLAAYYPLHSR